MKHILLLISIIIFATVTNAHAGNITYSKRLIRGVPVHIVTANLNSPDVKVSPAIAKHGIGTSEGYGSMLTRLQPSASITGTYFCVRSLIPVGHIIVENQFINRGSVGTGVCITPANTVEFIPMKYAAKTDWTSYTYAIRTGPRLVNSGVVSVSPRAEGFRDVSIYRKAQRSALGVTGNNKLLLITVNKPIYLSKLAHILKDLGAVDAVNLDGGSSTALSYHNRVLSHPGRRLTNLLVVYDSPAKYARIREKLAPTPLLANTDAESRG